MVVKLATRTLPFEDVTSPVTSQTPPTPTEREGRRRVETPTSPVVASPLPPPSIDGPVGGCLQESRPEWQKIS